MPDDAHADWETEVERRTQACIDAVRFWGDVPETSPAPRYHQWTIYDHPADHPDHIVVRRWEIRAGSTVSTDDDVQLHDTLADARAALPPGLVCLARAPEDDPVIVETWL